MYKNINLSKKDIDDIEMTFSLVSTVLEDNDDIKDDIKDSLELTYKTLNTILNKVNN